MNNKIRKYFAYGIGEIILVVIGILIALQIDNWNDKRIQNNEEQLLIQNLSAEFKANLKQLDEDFIKITEVNSGLRELMAVISSQPEGFSDDQVDQLIYKSFTAPAWNPSSYVLSDLKNSGRLSTINNNALKQLLFDWERIFQAINSIRENYRLFSVDYYRYITEHGSIRNIDALQPDNKLDKSSLPISNLTLLDQAEFENATSNFYALSSSLLRNYNIARKKIIAIIEAADSSIKSE